MRKTESARQQPAQKPSAQPRTLTVKTGVKAGTETTTIEYFDPRIRRR